MSLRICLVNPPIREWAKPNQVPMGLLMISTVLRENGHNVDIFDVNGPRLTQEEVRAWIANQNYDLYGIGGLITQWNYIRWCTDVIKEYHPDTPIMAGGPVVSNSPKLFAQRMAGVDVMVVGEGEHAVLDVVRDVELGNITSNKSVTLTEQPLDAPTRTGLCSSDIEIIKPVYQSPAISNLDELPFPDFDNLETVSIYRSNPVGGTNTKVKWIDGAAPDVSNLTLITTRGCPFRCRFCQPRYLGDAARSRSAEKICDDMERLVERYGVTYIHFTDELCFFSKRKALLFSEEVIRRGLQKVVQWGGATRFDIHDRDSFESMAAGGCLHVGGGIESLSTALLKAMDKYQHLQCGVDSLVEKLRLGREIIEDVDTSFIIGYPGETRETITETILNMQRIDSMFRPDAVFFATPYPGPWLWDYAVKEGFIPDPIQHIESLGENSVNQLMNFTEIPSEELRMWKRRLEQATMEVPNPVDLHVGPMEWSGTTYSYPT